MKKFIKGCGLLLAFAMTALVFVGCAPSNIEKAKAKLEEAEYKVEVYDAEAIEFMAKEMEGLEGYIVAMKGSVGTDGVEGEMVAGMLFESKKAAKAYWEANKDEVPEGYAVEISGKWLVSGTEAGVKAFLG